MKTKQFVMSGRTDAITGDSRSDLDRIRLDSDPFSFLGFGFWASYDFCQACFITFSQR